MKIASIRNIRKLNNNAQKKNKKKQLKYIQGEINKIRNLYRR